MSATPPPDDNRQPHDPSQREALHTRVSAKAAEALRSFASAQDVTISSLIDALLHALDDADRAWLDDIINQARAFDVRSRSKDTLKKKPQRKNTQSRTRRSGINGSRWR